MYHAPVARPSSGKSTTLPLDWDTATSSLSVTLPHLEYPAVLVYGLSTSLPDLKASGGIGIGKPSWLKIHKLGGDSDSSSSSDDDEKVKKEKAKKPEKSEKAPETKEKKPEKAPDTKEKKPEKAPETKDKEPSTPEKSKEPEAKSGFDLGKVGVEFIILIIIIIMLTVVCSLDSLPNSQHLSSIPIGSRLYMEINLPVLLTFFPVANPLLCSIPLSITSRSPSLPTETLFSMKLIIN